MATRTKTSKAVAECNVPDCTRKPTRDGLCDGHWATQRGLRTRTKKG